MAQMIPSTRVAYFSFLGTCLEGDHFGRKLEEGGIPIRNGTWLDNAMLGLGRVSIFRDIVRINLCEKAVRGKSYE
jgi:hypothetical protein